MTPIPILIEIRDERTQVLRIFKLNAAGPISVFLRNIGKPIFIAANKSETRRVEEEAGEFFQFGFELTPLSAEHGTSVGDLLDNVFDVLDFGEEVDEGEPAFHAEDEVLEGDDFGYLGPGLRRGDVIPA